MMTASGPPCSDTGRHRIVGLVAAGAVIIGLGPLHADDAGPLRDAGSGELIAFMLGSCQAYQISTSTHPEDEWTLFPEPVLRWSNPVAGTTDGITALWTRRGRPEVAAQVFRDRNGQWRHHLVPLTSDPLVVKRGNEVVWSPHGVCTVKPLESAPLPASTSALRLAQLRRSAERFTASIDFRHQGMVGTTETHQLRLMNSPLLRFGSSEGPVRDGVLFAFVMGTVPKVLLLLESRKTADGYGWHYSLSPITAYGVAVRLDGEVIWEHGESARTATIDDSFYLTRFSE